jgi:methylmalonyl-CoA mutase
MPVFGTMASQFNDPGMNNLYKHIINTINTRCGTNLESKMAASAEMSKKIYIIPPDRTRYLSEISETIRTYDAHTLAQAEKANLAQAYKMVASPSPSKGGETVEISVQR